VPTAPPFGTDRTRRRLAAGGALACAAAIAWGAYAAHAVDPALRPRADSAMLLLFLHGLALVLLAPRQRTRLEALASFGWALGAALFCGSLMLSVLTATGTRLAPVGGVLLILAWLLHAIAALRR
jgi:uncharacterized membrane protein YgdD (TMEM256/DUF423 family)